MAKTGQKLVLDMKLMGAVSAAASALLTSAPIGHPFQGLQRIWK